MSIEVKNCIDCKYLNESVTMCLHKKAKLVKVNLEYYYHCKGLNWGSKEPVISYWRKLWQLI